MTKFVLLLLFVLPCTYGVPIDSTNSLVISSTTTSDRTSDEDPKEGWSPSVNSKTPQIYQMQVTSKITNRFAHTTVRSKVKNVATKSQEATFSIILPDKAFISGFIMEVNGKNYTAYVQEKEEAKKTYDKAVASGQGAAHVAVSARDSNSFTVSVNVEPETKAAFYLSYEELLQRLSGRYELLINLHPGQLVKDLSVDVAISESQKIVDLKAPPLRSGNEISNDKAELEPRAEIKVVDDKNVVVTFSPNIEKQKEYASLLGTKQDDGFSGQFVVQYDVDREPNGGEVLVQDGYFVHFFAPSELKPIPKHVVFILDTSSSMYGQKIVQLREAMLKILEQLNEHDKFNLVEFNSNVKVWDLFDNEKSVWFPVASDKYVWSATQNVDNIDFSNFTFPAAYPATADNIRKAKEAVRVLTPEAATDIYSSLRVGLHLVELGKTKDNSHQPMIMFLTDGDPTVRVTSTEKIITKVTEYNSGSQKSAIFTLSFGDDADKDFLKKIALRNLGFSRHIYEAADAALQLENFYRQISSPLLANVHFKYAPSTTSLTTTDFPIHFGGSELVVAGFCGTDFLPPIIDGWGDHGIVSFKPKVEQSVSSIERLWAYLTVQQLLEEKESSEKEQEETNKKALELSLKYQFVTSVSSLVVVKPNATDNVRPVPAVKKEDLYGGDDDYDRIGDFSAAAPSGEFLNELAIAEITYEEDSRIFAGNFKLGLNDTITDVVPYQIAPLTNTTGHCTLLHECKQVYLYGEDDDYVPLRGSGAAAPSGGFSAIQYEEDSLIEIVIDEQFASTVSSQDLTTEVSTTEALTSDIFISISWLKNVLKDGFLSLTKGNFKLGLNYTITDVVPCQNAPLTNTTGHCTLLHACKQVHSLLTSKDVFEECFCVLKNEYAGVCCPNGAA